MGMGDQPQLQTETPPPRRWGVPRAAVRLLLLFFRQREAVQPKPDPLPTPVVASKPRGHEEAKTLPSQPETDATKKNEVVSQPDPGSPDLHKKTARRRWRVLSSVTKVLLSFFRHRGVSRPEPGPPPAPVEISKDEAVAETKVSSKQPAESEDSTNGEVIKPQEEGKEKEKEPPGWSDLDKSLEEVLEQEGIKHIRRYYNKLLPVLQDCMLCYSIFKPHSKIKKKTMIYWWIGRELAKPENDKTAEEVAEGYFQDLVKVGFIEPIINNCTGAIHDCRIHPFVHWMIKYQARSSSFCYLDERGNPSPNHREFSCMCLIEESSNKEQASGSSNVENTHTIVLFNLDKKKCNLDTGFLSHFGELVVLQLGRWHSDAKHLVEVEDFESLSSIGHLKKLRYLGLLGLSRLTTLPADIKDLSDLIILDLRDCQNLDKVLGQVTKLRKLTHLDLTECYMLEHIARGIDQLSELQVFKGFVFGESKRKNRCSLRELSKLTKLRKLSINITSGARIDEGEMDELENFQSLRSLTITWGQIPQFLGKEGKEGTSKNDKLKQNWTGFKLPKNLDKFDIRCFPYEEMPNWFEGITKLTKLYIRGGKLQALAPNKVINILILRLKYLEYFDMEWKVVKALLPNLDHLEVFKCSKVPKEGFPPLDDNGVWIKDEKDKKYEANSSQGNAAIPTGKVASSAPAPEHAPSDSASTVKLPPTSPAPNVTEVTTTTTPPDATAAIRSAADVTKDGTPTAKPDPSPAAASPGPSPSPPEDATSALKSDAGPLAPPAALASTIEGGKDATPMPESDLTPAATPAPSSPKAVEDDILPPKSDASPLASAPAPCLTANDATHTTESGLSLAAATPATSLGLKADDTAPSTKTSDAAPLNAA